MNVSQYAGCPVRQLRAGAARVERHDHVVAHGDGGDAGSDGVHDAGALVAADDRQWDADAGDAREHVGVAHPDTDDAHEHLTRPGLAQFELLDRVRRLGISE